MPALEEVILYLGCCRRSKRPSPVARCCQGFVFFFLWSCLNSHLALPLSSSRSGTKLGAWGVFTHFPSPLSYTLITGLELSDNAESVAFTHTLTPPTPVPTSPTTPGCFADSSPRPSCTKLNDLYI